MEYFHLLLGLTMPWIGAYYLLRVVEARVNPDHPPNFFRQVGYSLFLGYAMLYLVILVNAALFQQIHYYPVLAVICTIAIIGGLIAYKGSTPTAPATANRFETEKISLAKRLLAGLLLSWITIHITLTAVEIVYRPVFPWDAWLNWMYRAKAWFLQGEIFAFSSSLAWATDLVDRGYNVDGHNYPGFVPVAAFWAATSLGIWSDTSVNLPVLFIGVALAMATYGSCRESGCNYLLSLVPAYFLVSIPLIGTHLSLAGMADIWMAGFTGLGFISLIRGIIENSRYQLVLGLVMSALAATVKIEGAVWFVTAIATLLLVARPALTISIAGVFLTLALMAWILDTTYAVIPGVGTVGYAEGMIHVPFKGGYPLMQFELTDEYFSHFFCRGSWNLLWGLVLLSLPLLISQKNTHVRRPLIIFYIAFIATQVIIFGFTEQGKWAEDGTAINRLPLHFTPALVFCLMITVVSFLRYRPSETGKTDTHSTPISLPFSLIPPLVAAALVGGAVSLYFFLTSPISRQEPLVFEARDMAIVVGGGHIEYGIGIIESYRNNIAIVSSGPVFIDAESLTLLSTKTGGENRKAAGFFWRKKGDAENVESLSLNEPGVEFIDLSSVSRWKGTVTEIGLVFYKDDQRAAEFHQLSLSSASVESSLHNLWAEWVKTERWGQYSANWIAGGGRDPKIPLPIIVLAWLVVVVIIYLVYGGKSPRYLNHVLVCSLTAWMVMDIRWTANRLQQAEATIASSPRNGELSYIDIGDDKQLAEFIQLAKAQIPDETAQIMIVGSELKLDFPLFRAKYHLLPHPAYVHKGEVSSIPRKPVNYILLLKPIFRVPGSSVTTAPEMQKRLQEQLDQDIQIIIDREQGTLFKAVAN
jgi:hypothetical protein